jgi:cysteinyl-tRNA synthetase
MLKLYNTLTRRKEPLEPIHDNEVGLYTCGPTVYNFVHIGNLRTYIFEDILERTLEYNGLEVKRVMNITDVGHLTSDADEGEDKLDRQAKTEKRNPLEIAKHYTEAFLEDCRKLNIKIPEILEPATKHIDGQITIIKKLFEKGVAYETPSAVYFDVSKFPNYGKLSGQSLKDKMTAARDEVVTDPEKHNAPDFALWFKRVGRFENHILHWPSPWGEGFPGWHIECSAISTKFLGQPFDIHTGGVDHIGTHHENEIAQSEAAYGKPLANIWMHGEFLLVDDAKMAKSAGNFYTMKDIEERNINPLAFRYLVLGAHYRSKLNFTWEALEAARNGLDNLYDSFTEIYIDLSRENDISTQQVRNGTFREQAKRAENEFKHALQDDLNTPQALAVAWDVIKSKELSAREKKMLFNAFDVVLGLDLETTAKRYTDIVVPKEVQSLVQEREKSRANQQFAQADALRQKIEALGYSVRDTDEGPQISLKR